MPVNTFKLPTLGSWTTVPNLTLNSLANDARVLSDEINNSSRHRMLRVKLVLGSFTPQSGGYIEIYMIRGDGTDFMEGSASIDPQSELVLHRFYLRAAAAARSLDTDWKPATNRFKLLVRNKSGVALASSGCTAQYQLASPTVES